VIILTGVFDGSADAVMLRAMQRNDHGKLISIDLPAVNAIKESTDQMLNTILPPGKQPGWVVPEELRARYDLRNFDGVLAFGRVISELYRSRGWAARAWTWHEAADIRVFGPRPAITRDGDLVWIGNWGDGERTDRGGAEKAVAHAAPIDPAINRLPHASGAGSEIKHATVFRVTRNGYDAAAPRRTDAAPFEGVEFCCRAGELCHERFLCPISPQPL
jgi:hypothetical protein